MYAIILIKTSDGKNKYAFNIKNNALIFKEKESSVIIDNIDILSGRCTFIFSDKKFDKKIKE